jgi:hypothetical protein
MTEQGSDGNFVTASLFSKGEFLSGLLKSLVEKEGEGEICGRGDAGLIR